MASNDLKLRTVKPLSSKVPQRRKIFKIDKAIELPADTFIGDDADNFSIGSPANRKAKKAARLSRKQQRADDRSYKKRVKADSLAKRYSGKAEAAIIQAQGEAANNAILAQQGIVGNPVTQQPGLADKAMDIVGGYLGGGGQLQDSSLGLTSAEDYPDYYPEEQQPKNNMMMYIIIGAIILIGGFLILRKK